MPSGPTRRSPWKSALAGAVMGFLEAAGSESERRVLSRPLAVIRYEEGESTRARRPGGLWFLDPLPRPRPDPGGRRRVLPERITAMAPEWLARRLMPWRGLAQ